MSIMTLISFFVVVLNFKNNTYHVWKVISSVPTMSSPAFCILLPYYNIHCCRSKFNSQVNIFPLCMYLDVLVSCKRLSLSINISPKSPLANILITRRKNKEVWNVKLVTNLPKPLLYNKLPLIATLVFVGHSCFLSSFFPPCFLSSLFSFLLCMIFLLSIYSVVLTLHITYL